MWIKATLLSSAMMIASIPVLANSQPEKPTTQDVILTLISQQVSPEDADQSTPSSDPSSREKASETTTNSTPSNSNANQNNQKDGMVKPPEDLRRMVNSLTPEERDVIRGKIMAVYERTENQAEMLLQLMASGDANVSPKEIILMRTLYQLLQKAENQPLSVIETINAPMTISRTDRYKSYTVKINENGVTMMEFLDATGKPWPIQSFEPAAGFAVNKISESDHLLKVNNETLYAQRNLFVLLKGYPNPIQINLKYSDTERHGLVTFSTQMVRKVKESEADNAQNESVQAGINSNSIARYSNSSKEMPTTLNFEELNHIAATGQLKANGLMETKASRISTSAPEKVSMWMVDEFVLIRTHLIPTFHTEDAMTSADGKTYLYVASVYSALDAMITFIDPDRGESINVMIPSYHLYLTGISNE